MGNFNSTDDQRASQTVAPSEWPHGFRTGISGRGARPNLTPEQLFSELDGHEVVRGDAHYTIEVYGVSDWGGQRWIQAALTGTDGDLIVKVSPAESTDVIAGKLCTLALHGDESAVA